MVKLPAKFGRLAAAFNAASDGGEDENGADLFDLVNSFLERESRGDGQSDEDDWENAFDDDDYRESRDSLNRLLDGGGNDAVRGRIQSEAARVCREIGLGNSSSPEFKRRLIARLRSRGLDAGLCVSKCEKDGRRPFGENEYVDVYAGGDRYIIEAGFDGEFTIARPTVGYSALLEVFPPIFVGKSNEVEQVVRIMCKAIRVSMRRVGITVPPWRRIGYMHSKWFGFYKRTTNDEIVNVGWNIVADLPEKRRAMESRISFDCRYALASKDAGVGRVGNLAAVLNRRIE